MKQFILLVVAVVLMSGGVPAAVVIDSFDDTSALAGGEDVLIVTRVDLPGSYSVIGGPVNVASANTVSLTFFADTVSFIMGVANENRGNFILDADDLSTIRSHYSDYSETLSSDHFMSLQGSEPTLPTLWNGHYCLRSSTFGAEVVTWPLGGRAFTAAHYDRATPQPGVFPTNPTTCTVSCALQWGNGWSDTQVDGGVHGSGFYLCSWLGTLYGDRSMRL